ncbi:PHP domain-containing protein [Mycolicibacterium moriokaense]|nr:PHP domain-containing protein [Mycolicibacterium moriokaense]
MKPADNHVHTRWSWDTATTSSMRLACARAVELGIPAVAFTEHVDFTDWVLADGRRVAPLDVEGYLADVVRCRDEFPDLRILAGMEAGEPHLFPVEVGAMLAAGDFQRVLGSLHGLRVDGGLRAIGRRLFEALDPHELMRHYFTQLVDLVTGSSVFSVLAHCDYPRRYWPTDRVGDYDDADFEEEYRTVFRALASSGRALEINTRSPMASVSQLRWWWQEGGDAVSFGSDAHEPLRVGEHFDVAVDIAEAAGFRPGRDRFDFWRR